MVGGGVVVGWRGGRGGVWGGGGGRGGRGRGGGREGESSSIKVEWLWHYCLLLSFSVSLSCLSLDEAAYVRESEGCRVRNDPPLGAGSSRRWGKGGVTTTHLIPKDPYSPVTPGN